MTANEWSLYFLNQSAATFGKDNSSDAPASSNMNKQQRSSAELSAILLNQVASSYNEVSNLRINHEAE